MRNPDRIPKILNLIYRIWKRQNTSDLRLCQLIGNCFDVKDLYYVEDEELVEKLKATYGNDL